MIINELIYVSQLVMDWRVLNNRLKMEPTSTKTGISIEREKFTTEVRRAARLQDISMRRNRNINLDSKEIPLSTSIMNQPNLEQKVREFLASESKGDIEDYIQKFKSSDPVSIHEGVINIRKLLSSSSTDPFMFEKVQKVIDSNIVIKLIGYMKQSQYPRMQIESAWIITNILAGTASQCSSVTSKGAIPVMINLLESKDLDVVEQIVWGIRNICTDSAENREQLLIHNIIPKLTEVINNCQREIILNQAVCSLSSLCRKDPLPPLKYLRQLAHLIFHLLAADKVKDSGVVNEIIWAVVILTDVKYNLIQALESSNAVPSLVKVFRETPETDSIIAPLLSIFGNLTASEDKFVDYLLQFEGILRLIEQKMYSPIKAIRKQTIRFFQFYSSGTLQHIQLMLESETIIQNIIRYLDDELDIQIIAVKTLSNLIGSPMPKLLEGLYRLQVYKKIVVEIESQEVRMVSAKLECIEMMLMAGEEISNGESQNLIKVELDRHGLIDKLEKLQEHPSDEVYECTHRILQRFYEPE